MHTEMCLQPFVQKTGTSLSDMTKDNFLLPQTILTCVISKDLSILSQWTQAVHQKTGECKIWRSAEDIIWICLMLVSACHQASLRNSKPSTLWKSRCWNHTSCPKEWLDSANFSWCLSTGVPQLRAKHPNTYHLSHAALLKRLVLKGSWIPHRTHSWCSPSLYVDCNGQAGSPLWGHTAY